jgi:hypothetical protein
MNEVLLCKEEIINQVEQEIKEISNLMILIMNENEEEKKLTRSVREK